MTKNDLKLAGSGSLSFVWLPYIYFALLFLLQKVQEIGRTLLASYKHQALFLLLCTINRVGEVNGAAAVKTGTIEINLRTHTGSEDLQKDVFLVFSQ
jgi:hypothetical protein